jgi:hypothetical protein
MPPVALPPVRPPDAPLLGGAPPPLPAHASVASVRPRPPTRHHDRRLEQPERCNLGMGLSCSRASYLTTWLVLPAAIRPNQKRLGALATTSHPLPRATTQRSKFAWRDQCCRQILLRRRCACASPRLSRSAPVSWCLPPIPRIPRDWSARRTTGLAVGLVEREPRRGLGTGLDAFSRVFTLAGEHGIRHKRGIRNHGKDHRN